MLVFDTNSFMKDRKIILRQSLCKIYKIVWDIWKAIGKSIAFSLLIIWNILKFILSYTQAKNALRCKNCLWRFNIIIERNKIQNSSDILDILLNFISSAIGSLTNPLKLSNRFLSENKISISHNTISKYLSYFEESYILYSAKRYDIKGVKYFTTPLKYYFADIGLRNARLNFRQVEETHIMENIIYNDLIRRGYNVDIGVVEYTQTKENKNKKIQLEVDFVVNRGNIRYYIQSALALSNEEKREQEINSLKRINDSFKKIVVVKDDIIPRYDEQGIYYIGVKDFLLTDSIFKN